MRKLYKNQWFKRSDEREGDELRNLNNHYLDRCKYFLKTTEKSYNELFGDVLGKKGSFCKRITKLMNILATMMWTLVLKSIKVFSNLDWKVHRVLPLNTISDI